MPLVALSPRIAPTADILNTPDDAGYATRKANHESSSEYMNSSYLARINAAAAYARGATGVGEIVAITDSGIRETHREFTLPDGSSKASKTTDAGYTPTDADKEHGTAVAALAVGGRDAMSGDNMQGVAYDAEVLFHEAEGGISDGTYRPVQIAEYGRTDDAATGQEFALDILRARNGGAAVLNYSFGEEGGIDSYSQGDIRTHMRHTAAAFAQTTILAADKLIVVWAAGNAGAAQFQNGTPAPKTSVEVWAGLGVHFSELQSHVLAVVSLDQSGTISDFSNRCGIAKAFCIAAPGEDLFTASSLGDQLYRSDFSGTSFATPLVSGSLALLRQYFRQQLGNTELVNRLLATANRTGIYANSDIYGHGLVDLDAATAPVGPVMTGMPGDPARRPLAEAGIALSGGAFGSSLQGQLEGVEAAGFDSLGAPFFYMMSTGIS